MNSNKQFLYLIIGFSIIVIVCVELHLDEIIRIKKSENGNKNTLINYKYENLKNKNRNRNIITNIEPVFRLQSTINGITISGNLPKTESVIGLNNEISSLFYDKNIDNSLVLNPKVNLEKWVDELSMMLRVLEKNRIDELSVFIEGEQIEIKGIVDTQKIKTKIEEELFGVTSLFVSNSIKLRNKKDTSLQIQRVIDKLLKKNTIKFEKKSDFLTDEAKATLLKIVESLKKVPNEKIRVEGHTNEYNHINKDGILSQNRADKVRDFFIKNGLNGDRMMSIGYGSSRLDEKSNSSKVEIYIM